MNIFISTMLRIAAMNLQLHAVDKPNLKSNASSREQFSLILANPPFISTAVVIFTKTNNGGTD